MSKLLFGIIMAKPSDIFDHQEGSIGELNLADITYLKQRGAGIQNEVIMGEKLLSIYIKTRTSEGM